MINDVLNNVRNLPVIVIATVKYFLLMLCSKKIIKLILLHTNFLLIDFLCGTDVKLDTFFKS